MSKPTASPRRRKAACAVDEGDCSSVLSAIPLPFWIEEAASGRILHVNREACELYGYSHEAFLSITSASLCAADSDGSFASDAATAHHVTRTGRPLVVELLRRDMTYGGVPARLVMARELLPLTSREERFRALIEESSDIIYETDPGGHFTFVNPAVRRVLGYEPESLIGRHFTQLVRKDWKAATIEHYKAQRSSSNPTTYFEFAALGASGRTVWVGQSVESVIGAEGVAGFRAIARDITAQKIAEERFKVFMNNSSAPAFVKRPDGQYVYANELMDRLFARPGETVIGRTDGDLTSTAVEPAIRDTDTDVLVNNHSVQVIESFPTTHGEMRQWLVHKFPVPELDGTTFVGGIAVDITERIALEQELAAARDAALLSGRQKSKFLANMSHEIRTPMNGVLGLLGLLLDSTLDADQRDLAETARSSAESLLTIINDILDFSKIEAGKLRFEMADFELQNVCESTLDLLGDTARQKSLEIGLVLDPNIPQVLAGDSGRLRQVLLNLLGNSIKFTQEGGVLLQVEAVEQTDQAVTLQFRINDTGIGMSEPTRQRLFKPFSQGDESTTRTHGGTGLGLAISKQLVQMMDGEIGVDSEPGCGSTFWFTAKFLRGRSEGTSFARRSGAPRVLIVEDSTTSRQVMTLQLTGWGVPNEAAADGLSALAMLREAQAAGQPYQLVLSDVHLPGVDGVTLARLLQDKEKFGAPRLILITGTKAPFDAAAASHAGVACILRKPVKQQQLFSAVFGDGPVGRRPAPAPATPTPATVPMRRRLLVVEDNVVNQKVILRLLQKLGFAGEAVGNGLEALDALDRIAYDLVLMDCQMPEMDGYEATAEIRMRDAAAKRHTPIVALTASAAQNDRDRCLSAGMDDFISKPVRTDDLSSVLLKWLPDDRLNGQAENAPAVETNGAKLAS